MAIPPVRPHHWPRVGRDETDRAIALAERLRPSVGEDQRFRDYRTTRLEPAPTLELDDFRPSRSGRTFEQISFLQQRARLRADDGDFVASFRSPPPAWEDYCRQYLGLGRPRWLIPHEATATASLASTCWIDREARRTLVGSLRRSRLHYLHPYRGYLSVWQLAWLLHQSSRRPVQVIAPPPGLADRVNDKGWFCAAVRQLFGNRSLPPTHQAGNLSTLALLVRSFDRRQRIVIKLPDASGGTGNLVLDARALRGHPLGALRRFLRGHLARLGWNQEDPLLISAWEDDVLGSPSTQIWIPPLGDGEPSVEGVFEQVLSGIEGSFEGSRPSTLPPALEQRMVDQSYLLARLFQELGYVGRCSFDLLVLGNEPSDARLEFIECNGRWGGTSLPMSMLNRVLGDWAERPYYARNLLVTGIDRLPGQALLEHFESDLFDRRTGRGRLIFYNLGWRGNRPTLSVIGLAETQNEAELLINEQVTERLRGFAHRAQIESTRASISSSTVRTDPSGTSCQGSSEIGSEATTTAR